MSSSSKSNIHLDLQPIAKTQNLSISLTLPFACCGDYISMLENCVPCSIELSKGAEESAYAFALFLLLKEKMTTGATGANKFRIDHIVCRGHNGHLVIAWNTQGTGSSLKRTIGAVLKFLRPHSIYTGYSHCILHLGGKPVRAVFNFLANEMIKSLEKIHFVAVGKINPNVKAEEVLLAVFAKFESCKKESDATAPEKHPPIVSNSYTIECPSGAIAVLVSNYLMRTKVSMCICDKDVVVFNPNFDTIRKKNKEKRLIDAYVKLNFSKQGDLATRIFAHYANSNALASGHNIMAIVKMTDIAGAIHKAL